MTPPLLVTTRTPLRIGFAGGGTDLPAFYEKESGSVLSSTIDKYLYVTVKRHHRLFGEKYRLNYSETERADKLDEIKNEIARECLRFLGVKHHVYISTIADLPGSSGLGSSSSFCVGLLNALHAFIGKREVSAAQLAEEACHIEIDVLRKPIGRQDQYAAAFGGFNHFFFHKGGKVTISHKHLPGRQLDQLFDNLLLFWTGISRSADAVLKEQQKNTAREFQRLREMRDLSDRLWASVENGTDIADLGQILHEGWERKRLLTGSISNPQIDRWYKRAVKAGAHGGKLCGAGGGGFLLFVVPKAKRAAVCKALSELTRVDLQYESHGSKVIYTQQDSA